MMRARGPMHNRTSHIRANRATGILDRLDRMRQQSENSTIDPWQGRLTDAFVEAVIEEIVWTLRRRD